MVYFIVRYSSVYISDMFLNLEFPYTQYHNKGRCDVRYLFSQRSCAQTGILLVEVALSRG